MKYEEISNTVQFNEKYESNLFMPNEVFDDLKKVIKNTPHIAFSYTYIYLCTWLYRYVKHYTVKPFSNDIIKELLGYNANNRTLNYLIKKNGKLDEMEYLESIRDYPVGWEISDSSLKFTMSSELSEFGEYMPIVDKRSFLKRPLKGFYRIMEEEGEEYEIPGTFHEIDNTHNISFEIFLYCMNNKNIGCTGFFLYAYLKHKNDLFGSYDVSLKNLSEETGISETGLDRYLGALKQYEMISFYHNQEFFTVGLLETDRKANTYTTNEYCMFGDKPMPFEKINIMKRKDYLELLKEKRDADAISFKSKKSDYGKDFNIDDLPY